MLFFDTSYTIFDKKIICFGTKNNGVKFLVLNSDFKDDLIKFYN